MFARNVISVNGSSLAPDVWCYEQVCLVEMFKLLKMLLANLLIARVTCKCYDTANIEHLREEI